MAAALWIGLLCLQDPAEQGDKAYREGRYADAAAHWETAAKKNPSPPLFANLGHAYGRLGKYPEAAASYRRAIDGGLSTPELHLALGQVLYLSGRGSEAMEALLKADPAGAAVWIARIYMEREDWTLAEHELVRHLRASPSDVEGKETFALLMARTGRHVEAARVYEELYRKHPDRPRYVMELARVRVQAGRSTEAIHTLEMARLLGFADAATLRLLGDLYLQERMFGEAARTYGRVASTGAPMAAEDHFRVAHAWHGAGEWVSAGTSCKAALAADARHFEAWMLSGQIAAKREDIEGVRASSAKAAALQPDSPRPWTLLAEAEWRKGAFDRADHAYEEAIRRGAGDANVYHQWVLARLESKGPEAAREALKKAWAAHPADPRFRALIDRLVP